VDSPETSHPRLGEQPYGQEAKSFIQEIVEEADILELEFDIGPTRENFLDYWGTSTPMGRCYKRNY
jgi:micrococcal nuclease